VKIELIVQNFHKATHLLSIIEITQTSGLDRSYPAWAKLAGQVAVRQMSVDGARYWPWQSDGSQSQVQILGVQIGHIKLLISSESFKRLRHIIYAVFADSDANRVYLPTNVPESWLVQRLQPMGLAVPGWSLQDSITTIETSFSTAWKNHRIKKACILHLLPYLVRRSGEQLSISIPKTSTFICGRAGSQFSLRFSPPFWMYQLYDDNWKDGYASRVNSTECICESKMFTLYTRTEKTDWFFNLI
jgi:hypothetical protein